MTSMNSQTDQPYGPFTTVYRPPVRTATSLLTLNPFGCKALAIHSKPPNSIHAYRPTGFSPADRKSTNYRKDLSKISILSREKYWVNHPRIRYSLRLNSRILIAGILICLAIAAWAVTTIPWETTVSARYGQASLLALIGAPTLLFFGYIEGKKTAKYRQTAPRSEVESPLGCTIETFLVLLFNAAVIFAQLVIVKGFMQSASSL